MPIKSVSHEEEESAQFKELFVVIMALDSTPEPFSLFPDSLYVVSLLPNLVEAHVELQPYIPSYDLPESQSYQLFKK